MENHNAHVSIKTIFSQVLHDKSSLFVCRRCFYIHRQDSRLGTIFSDIPGVNLLFPFVVIQKMVEVAPNLLMAYEPPQIPHSALLLSRKGNFRPFTPNKDITWS
ncbi:hypothetical protein RDI58_026729 [Solanum bulbocastanum]|uniref:Uncharacterized protein n=1 Tax=Solanum bulbocastanum TaxID=147425 RepID=A0AAN8SU65_SOLBU